VRGFVYSLQVFVFLKLTNFHIMQLIQMSRKDNTNQFISQQHYVFTWQSRRPLWPAGKQREERSKLETIHSTITYTLVVSTGDCGLYLPEINWLFHDVFFVSFVFKYFSMCGNKQLWMCKKFSINSFVYLEKKVDEFRIKKIF